MKADLQLPDDVLEAIAARAAELVPAPAAPDPDRWLTAAELAAYLSMSERWVHYLRAGGMPHAEIGGKRRFKVCEVEPWMEEHGHMNGAA